ncbi:MAG: IclR family transcriptional regulator [Proteobacteria bacterium]|nr:IclR family transcriptional regulator [Pseudomonadota bacterium]MBU4276464.1 IclR family transcriptional regulator [Pseudomonadota bacterium]MBU4381739.1 IclR family transcriptional regulator [Pseudomonadota bacterium]MBU4605112.1 IclR family transcriptional regulator [Pseudomonadota bacterium]MCG2765693.1 IclR family transcriptional regulator [Desulfarculaceae bacterium]
MTPQAPAGADQETKKSQRGVQSIHRAIGLLRTVVAHNERGISLAALARECGLHVATARRMLGALENEGLINYDPVTKLYHLGIELFYFGAAAYQFQMRDRYRLALERIAQRTEDTSFLLVRSGNDALVIDRVEGAFPIRTLTHEVGQRSPLGMGAGSTVLLASLPEKKTRAIIQANKRRYAQYKNSTMEDVWMLIEHYRKHGYSLTGGVFIPEAVGLGRAVHDASGEVVAAISVAAIKQRMDLERREVVAEIIKQEIEAIEKPNG